MNHIIYWIHIIDQKDITIYEIANAINSEYTHQNLTETDYTTNLTDSPIYLSAISDENIKLKINKLRYTITISDISLTLKISTNRQYIMK